MWRILGDSLKRGVVTGKPGAPLPADVTPAPRECDAEIEALGQALRVEIQRLFKRSMKLRHVDCGSCNGCESELQALLNPFYDLQRFGIDFVASPRHADGVAVTGSVTRNLETAVHRTIEAIPEPRVVIAVGACAASGGIVGEGYASAGGVDRVAAQVDDVQRDPFTFPSLHRREAVRRVAESAVEFEHHDVRRTTLLERTDEFRATRSTSERFTAGDAAVFDRTREFQTAHLTIRRHAGPLIR